MRHLKAALDMHTDMMCFIHLCHFPQKHWCFIDDEIEQGREGWKIHSGRHSITPHSSHFCFFWIPKIAFLVLACGDRMFTLLICFTQHFCLPFQGLFVFFNLIKFFKPVDLILICLASMIDIFHYPPPRLRSVILIMSWLSNRLVLSVSKTADALGCSWRQKSNI